MELTIEQRIERLEDQVKRNTQILNTLTRSGNSRVLNNDAGAIEAGRWWSPYSS